MHAHRLVADKTGEIDDVRDDELGDGARVRERRIEHRDRFRLGRLQVDLIRADAEAPDREQILGALDHLLAHLRHRANADDMIIGNRRLQSVTCANIIFLSVQTVNQEQTNANRRCKPSKLFVM